MNRVHKLADSVSFQTRARTIDHLGREQIADVPTAVSELWKNAYDAYARAVSLHIYGRSLPLAAIYDNGHGMSRRQFLEAWLVVGTESKVAGGAPPEWMRNGLPIRPRQGQKGIGRLSVAALGSAVLIVSKRLDAPFVASFVDWRLFENPFLMLNDIRIPVVEFAEPKDLAGLLPSLQSAILENLAGSEDDPARRDRLAKAWEEFDELERTLSQDVTTAERIRRLADRSPFENPPLSDWSVWDGTEKSGTALVVADINHYLSVWLDERNAEDIQQSDMTRKSLVRTLTGFADPYAATVDAIDFKVVVHGRHGSSVPVAREDGYGIDFLRSLDHCLEGRFDEFGTFRGRIRAFGRDLGDVVLPPSVPPPSGARERVGGFDVVIGVVEQVAKASTLTPDVHERVSKRAEATSGLAIYRDGLRVMPYGRPDNDFFEVEDRRSKNAGRWFFSVRNIFGRIAISRSENPNLRDKAGREGLIDNQAARTLKGLMIGLLMTSAKRYFGSDSELRDRYLPEIKALNSASAQKAEGARSFQSQNFRAEVKSKMGELSAGLEEADHLLKEVRDALAADDEEAILRYGDRVEHIVGLRSRLRLPPKPTRSLGRFEKAYRDYRDKYSALAAIVDEVRRDWVDAAEKARRRSPGEVARSHLGRNQKALTDRLIAWRREAVASLSREIQSIQLKVDSDLKEFYQQAAPLLADLEAERVSLGGALEGMDEIRETLMQRFADSYEPYIRTLRQLAEGVDLDSAFAYAGEQAAGLERKLETMESLAQVGISVEIMTHELHDLEHALNVSLAALPGDCREGKPYQNVEIARDQLVERLRFLTEMQVAGADMRVRITGRMVSDYISEVFSHVLVERSITLEVSSEFEAAAFYEYRSRIYPVFINLVNNAALWTATGSDRRIRFDIADGALVVGDSGPGVDPDDQENLFELFFTRSLHGRGVGLYLCRRTLAAGGHTIDYVRSGPLRIMPGANFAIRLRNGFDA